MMTSITMGSTAGQGARVERSPARAGVIFGEALRRGWRTALWWGLGVGLLAFTQIIFVQDSESLQEISRLYETLPPVLVQALSGGEDLAFLATPEGYMASQFFAFGLLFLAIYGVTSGLNVSANDEDAGILNMVMGLPIRRAQLVLERLAAFAVLALLVVAQVYVWIAVGTLAVPGVGYNLSVLAAGTFNLLPGLLLIIAVSAALGAIFRRRGTAVAVAAVFILASYFIDFIALGAPESAIAGVASLSFFRYVGAVETVRAGLQWANIGLLLAAAGVFTLITVFAFERRDIGR